MYRLFRKELYNFESLYKFIQRTCTVFWTAPDPAGVGINLTTDMKRALITQNSGVQKSLIIFYPTKYLHTEFLTNHLTCIRKVLNDG
jgi:hypothetical protein